jgi:RecB family exonuclease
MASRENVRLIFGKRSVEGEPLVPSRLLFATGEQHIAERVRRFFAEPVSNTAMPLFGGHGVTALPKDALPRGDSSAFHPKEPPKTGFPFDRIRVTEFRDYLQCPFRYYLRHRLRLDITDDRAEELDGGAFGDLAHRVLKLFGRSECKNSQDTEQIAGYLSRQLDVVVADVYGKALRPVIDVQVEQLRLRLEAFAAAQAKRASEGFEILHVEYSPATPDGSTRIDVDGRPIKIRGRIDRVDFDHNSGKYVLLDYKTTASGDAPEKTHRSKDAWVDLQLPLYEWIFSEHHDVESEIEVGYVSLPKDTAKTGFLIAGWHYSDFEAARNTAKEIIRNIRREIFWPPAKPAPKFSEMYSAICNDKQIRLLDDDEEDEE